MSHTIPRYTPDKGESISEDLVFDFLEMSQRLLSLIKHENSIMEECGILSMENYLSHRDSLLKTYEKKASALLALLNSDNNGSDIHKLMLAEVASLQKALNDNTTHKFKSLEQSLSSPAVSGDCREGDRSWH